MSLIVLGDLKSGWVDSTTWLQLAAYGGCKTYPDNAPIPTIDSAMILKANDQGCEPLWCPRERLQTYHTRFLAFLDQWREMVKEGQVMNKDTYRITIDGEELLFPRVTAVLKGVLAREKLVQWQIKQAVTFTLTDMVASNRSPKDTLSLYQEGIFDPLAGALKHMKKRGGQGTDLHKCLQNYLLGLKVSLETEWLEKAFGHLKAWADQHQLKAVEGFIETKVYNPSQVYAGTLDFVASVEPCAGNCCSQLRGGSMKIVQRLPVSRVELQQLNWEPIVSQIPTVGYLEVSMDEFIRVTGSKSNSKWIGGTIYSKASVLYNRGCAVKQRKTSDGVMLYFYRRTNGVH